MGGHSPIDATAPPRSPMNSRRLTRPPDLSPSPPGRRGWLAPRRRDRPRRSVPGQQRYSPPLLATGLPFGRALPARMGSESPQVLGKNLNRSESGRNSLDRPQSGSPRRREPRRLSYSITSSASASRVGGIGRPSAPAVLRLTANSNLVGACAGSSAGFAPFRMRST